VTNFQRNKLINLTDKSERGWQKARLDPLFLFLNEIKCVTNLQRNKLINLTDKSETGWQKARLDPLFLWSDEEEEEFK